MEEHAMSQQKTQVAEVQVRFVDEDGNVIRTEYTERKLWDGGARKGWFFNDLSNTKNFVRQDENGAFILDRVVRK
jgi:hypothetical protein